MIRPFSVIVAMDSKRGIGKNNQLPWHLPGELRHFKTLTAKTKTPHKQNAVIMGRKTWASLPEKFRPLPGRINLVLTRDQKPELPVDVFFADSLEKGLSLLESPAFHEKIEHIFVIGGAQIFEAALRTPLCQELYVTHIRRTFDCDVFFPPFETQFERTNVSPDLEENGITYFFCEYRIP